MIVRSIYKWCENRINTCDIGILYVDETRVFLLNPYVVKVRKKFIIADLKKAGYWLGKERKVQEKYLNSNELKEFYTNVIQ